MNLSRMSFLVLLMMGTTFYVNGVTTLVNASSSQTPRSNKAPINHCNCHCTVNQDSRAIKALETKVEGLNNVLNNKTSAISDAVKSMEAKMESLAGPNNKTFGVSNGLEAKVERLTGLDNKTSSISYAVRSLDAKVEGLTEMSNKTSSISNAIKVLEAKVEGLRGHVNNKTFSISDAVKSLEKKVEALTELNNKTSSISGAVKSLEKKVEGLTEMINKTSGFSDAVNTLDAKMENIIRLINRTLFFTSQQPAPKPTVTSAAISSCQEQYLKDNSSKSQVFTLKFGLQTIPVYCHMGDFGCGGGGWTPVMKTDGTKRTFQYTSCIWTNKNGYNLAGGKTGFDTQETKLPTYWETNFSKICLGMKIGNQTNFIAFNKQASSLYSLIADGLYRSTSLGRNSWKALLGSQASLQRNCNREGFNTSGGRTSVRKARARIGILGNNENDCGTVNSRIGFGMQGIPDDSITCGVAAKLRSDNGDKFIRSFGYILVQ